MASIGYAAVVFPSSCQLQATPQAQDPYPYPSPTTGHTEPLTVALTNLWTSCGAGGGLVILIVSLFSKLSAWVSLLRSGLDLVMWLRLGLRLCWLVSGQIAAIYVDAARENLFLITQPKTWHKQRPQHSDADADVDADADTLSRFPIPNTQTSREIRAENAAGDATGLALLSLPAEWKGMECCDWLANLVECIAKL
ncbi:hypothetical protein ACLKA7_008155 [Drosophila subpalustris]